MLKSGKPGPRLLSGILLVLFFVGCRKPVGTNWDVGLVVPLVNSELNVRNFLPDSILATDSAGLLHLAYKREVAALLIDSLLDVPSTDTSIALAPPFAGTLQPGQQLTFFAPTELEFKIDGGVEIAYADIRQAFLHVKFSNQVAEPLDLIYRIPSATRNGVTFEIRETIQPGQNSLTKTYDLSGYRLKMRGLNGNKYNTIVQTYTVGLNPNAKPVVVQPGVGAIMDISYSGIVPQYIEGFFGQETHKLDADTVDFTFLENIRAENFLLSEATMKFSLLNQFGADFRGSLSGVTAFNSVSGKAVQLTSPQLSGIFLNWPHVKYADGVKASTTTLVFDHNNSNITQFISTLPDRISYQGSVRINPPPPGNDVGHTNYAFYNNGIRILADIDVPVKFTASRFTMELSTDIDLSGTEQLDDVRNGNFIVSVTNGFPFAAQLQVYMEDENGVVLDSLFSAGNNIVQPAFLGPQNEVTGSTSTDVYIPINQEKASNLRKTSRLRVRSALIMPPNPPEIRIYEHYGVIVKVRAEMGYNVGIR